MLTWYQSDYYLHYDPCLCNYKSSLVLEVKLSSNGNFNFKINGQALQNFSTGQSTDNHGRIGEKGLLSSFFNLNNQDYKSMPFFRDLDAGLNFGKNLVNSQWVTLPDKQKADLLNLFSGFSQNLPIVGAAAKFLTMIFDKNNPSQPQRPLVFDVKLTGNGSITYTYNYSFNELIIPGSEQTLLSTEVLPYYNKPVGVFTLVKDPVIEENRDYWYNDEFGTYERHEMWDNYQYKVSNTPIVYSVNPHAGFDLSQSSIKGQFIFEDNNNSYTTGLFDLGCLKDIQKSFSYYSSYSPEFPEWNYEEGWHPHTITLKIIAKFKVASTNLEVPYIGTYNVKIVTNRSLGFGVDAEPASTCAIGIVPATDTQIKEVCNSNTYKTKVSAFSRTVPDSVHNDIHIDSENTASIYPNPVVNNLTVNLKNDYSKGYKLQIFNSLGKAIFNKEYKNGGRTLVLSEVAKFGSGVYVLLVTSGNKLVYSGKFIKAK